MKRTRVYILLTIVLTGLLSGCVSADAVPAGTETIPETTATTEPTVLQTLPPTTEVPTQPAQEAHSPLYIPGIPAEDVIAAFNEVVLSAEFINSGDPSFLQKWTEPIFYRLEGDPTETDRQTLERFVLELNYIEGFPGMYESPDEYTSNLPIYFCSQEELLTRMGDQFLGNDGGVTFWYQENQIYRGILCIRKDLDQQLRNSVILEEIYNGLGPIQDTNLRPDSIIYSGFSQPQQLTDMDWLLLKLLYHPQMICGMTKDQCEAVIRQLYY